ncbi:MAG: sodium:calcium antiporter, partial [Microcystaceae cyanobacterium]
MTVITFVLLIIGLILLVAGAELLVKGASGLALMAGLSPLVIGLTIVAYGTSSPELIVSVQSSLANQADIALGNVVGSNIFNVLFILGISSLVTPLVVNQQLIRLDVPILIGVSALMLMFAVDGSISRVDGAIFFTGAIAYTVFQIW